MSCYDPFTYFAMNISSYLNTLSICSNVVAAQPESGVVKNHHFFEVPLSVTSGGASSAFLKSDWITSTLPQATGLSQRETALG